MLYFVNDYCEGAHPAILQKLLETNMEKLSGYGTDKYCDSAKEKIRKPATVRMQRCISWWEEPRPMQRSSHLS